jgi:hypothetical protein
MKNAPNAAARTPAKGGLRLAERIVRQRKRSPAPHAKAERMAMEPSQLPLPPMVAGPSAKYHASIPAESMMEAASRTTMKRMRREASCTSLRTAARKRRYEAP